MKVYLSHSIRGVKGSAATPTDMKNNCDRIIGVANAIRHTLHNAEVEIYVPAENERFVGISFRDGYLTEKQILEIDCKIIKEMCDIVIVNVPEGDILQGGRLVERDFAVANNIPVLVFSEILQAVEFITHEILRA